MDKLLEIKGYINQVQLKKVWFGGYSKEDVQVKMDMMMEIIEKTLKEQEEKEKDLLVNFEKEKEELRADLESKKKVSDILVVDLNKSIDELNELNRTLKLDQEKLQNANAELAIQNKKLIEENDRLTEEKNHIEQEHLSLKDKNVLLSTEKITLENECFKLKDAYNKLFEVKNLLEQDQLKMKMACDELLEENHQMAERQVKMKDAYRAYCGALLKEYSESLRSLSGEFSRILENVSNMQKEIDEESVFEGLERAIEDEKTEVLTGIVE